METKLIKVKKRMIGFSYVLNKKNVTSGVSWGYLFDLLLFEININVLDLDIF